MSDANKLANPDTLFTGDVDTSPMNNFVSTTKNSSANVALKIVLSTIVLCGLVLIITLPLVLLLQSKGDKNPAVINKDCQWNNWESWSTCSLTCGVGVTYRNRTCLTTNGTSACSVCIGDSLHAKLCGTDICISSSYSLWATWGKWSDCSATCRGGTQTRTRICQEQPEFESCVGNATNERLCNEFLCFDCSSSCSPGYVLNPSCTYCICSSPSLFNTTVITSGGSPIAGVAVHLTGNDAALVATTHDSGNVVLTEFCEDTQVTFTKVGYVSMTYSLGPMPGIIVMRKIEKLAVAISPTSKSRVVGDPVTFCCSFNGYPQPTYIEWLKNSQLLRISPNTYNSTVTIESVTLNEAASYTCRASNDYGSISSENAFLSVKESIHDFCNNTPVQNIVSLPNGCSFNGSSSVNVGQCIKGKCRGAEDASTSCIDEDSYCCGPLTQRSLMIPCDEFEYQIFVVESCGCLQCIVPEINIIGTVRNSINTTTIEGIEIVYHQDITGVTDAVGKFYINVPVGTTRVAVTAQDPNNTFVSTMAVLSLASDAEGTYFVNIDMMLQPQPIYVNAGENISLTLDSIENGDSLGEISIPMNSYYLNNGTAYNGSVQLVVTVLSPNDTFMTNAPGDFTAVDDEGTLNPLTSYGMFKIDVSTEDGRPLSVPEIQLTANPSVEPNENVKLWSINTETGIWELVDSTPIRTRMKRQTTGTIHGISYQSIWYNFDAVSSSTCYSKVRVYSDTFFTSHEQEPNVAVSVIITALDGAKSLSNYIYSPLDNHNGGYCIVHRCNSPDGKEIFTGLISAKSKNDGNINFYPENPSTLTKFNTTLINYSVNLKYFINVDLNPIASGYAGPFYDWDRKWTSSYTCAKADVNAPHFRFFRSSVGARSMDAVSYQMFQTRFTSPSSTTCLPEYYRLFNSVTQHIEKYFKSCFVRIKAVRFQDLALVTVLSLSGVTIPSASVVADKTLFGQRQLELQKSKFGCIEVKYPDDVGCSANSTYNIKSTYNLAKISVNISATYELQLGPVKLPVQYIKDGTPGVSTSIAFQMHKDLVQRDDLGIYCYTGATSADVNLNKAKGLCEQETNDWKYLAVFNGIQVRLMNGSTPDEGRVEILYEGQWGVVCDNRWDESDARVICNHLGLSVTTAYAVTKSYFGQGSGAIILDNVDCYGNEQNIGECKHPGWKAIGLTCNHAKTAGVQCANTTDLNIRLAGGNSSSEGQVEVLYKGQWRSICDNFWGYKDAEVVCRQLRLEGAEAVAGSYYGRPNSQYLLDDVQCVGSEDNLGKCRHGGLNIISSTCDSSKAAGVKCFNQSSCSFLVGEYDAGAVTSITLNGTVARIIARPNVGWVAVDVAADSIFYKTNCDLILYISSFRNPKNVPKTVGVPLDSSYCRYGLALDTIIKAVFIPDYFKVFMFTYQGAVLNSISKSNGSYSYGVAVDEASRILYWVSYETLGKIWRLRYTTSAFDGSPSVVFEKAGTYPTGIVYDYQSDIIYWATRFDGKIQSFDVNTNTSTTIFVGNDAAIFLTYGMAKCVNDFYLTDSIGKIWKISSAGLIEEFLLTSVLNNPIGIIFY